MEENTRSLYKPNKNAIPRPKMKDENPLSNPSYQKLPLSNTISERTKNNDQSQNCASISISSKNKSRRKRKYHIIPSEEEEIYYTNLFLFLDENKSGKLDAKKVASLMKKSGISNSKLKSIWLIASQSSIIYLEKSEFFVAMRLTALAQNNLPCDADSIEKNIIPKNLPKFNLFKIDSSVNDRIIFQMTENFLEKNKNIFDNNKNNNDNILISNSIIILKNIYNDINEDIIQKIITIITPFLQNNEYFNLREFQLFSYLISINDKYEIPNILPTSLISFLSDEKIFDDQNEHSTKKCDYYLDQIKITIKKINDLSSEYDSITKKINLHKEKIYTLFKEINNFEEEQKQIKQKLKYINNECAKLLSYINERKNSYLNSKNILLNNCVYKNDKNSFSMRNPFNETTCRLKDYPVSCTTSCVFKNINLEKNLFNFDDNSEENINSLKNNKKKLRSKNKSDLEYYINNNKCFFDEKEFSINNNENKNHIQVKKLKLKRKNSYNNMNQKITYKKLLKDKNSDKNMEIDTQKQLTERNLNSTSKKKKKIFKNYETGKNLNKSNKIIKIIKSNSNNNYNDFDIKLSENDIKDCQSQKKGTSSHENL